MSPNTTTGIAKAQIRVSVAVLCMRMLRHQYHGHCMSRMLCPEMRELPYTEGSAAVELGFDVGWLNTVMGSVHMRGLPRWVELVFGCLVLWLGS